ncbi:hypothetical protein EDD16DRAFT_1012280 [Pisolithus croceorrhizus]|nr:hypothetical protein EDD16DRAFT_1012280 [Pisolithus croceorrhizus]
MAGPREEWTSRDPHDFGSEDERRCENNAKPQILEYSNPSIDVCECDTTRWRGQSCLRATDYMCMCPHLADKRRLKSARVGYIAVWWTQYQVPHHRRRRDDFSANGGGSDAYSSCSNSIQNTPNDNPLRSSATAWPAHLPPTRPHLVFARNTTVATLTPPVASSDNSWSITTSKVHHHVPSAHSYCPTRLLCSEPDPSVTTSPETGTPEMYILA